MAATSSRYCRPAQRRPRKSNSEPASPASSSARCRRSQWLRQRSMRSPAGVSSSGSGSSHRVQVEPEHGVPYGKPLTRVRESVAIIRALLRDGRVSYAGETVRIEGFDLWFTPFRPQIPIYLSAVFPKMTTLCGEIADGVILTRSTLGHRGAGPGAARRRRQARRPRPEHDRRHLAVADRRRRDPQGGARRAAAGARLLCRLLPPLQPHDGRARLSRRGGRHCCCMVARRPRSGRAARSATR